MARLSEQYKEKVVPQLMEKFGYKSVMQVPRIEKITLNMGVGEAVADKKVMEFALGDMQKPHAVSSCCSIWKRFRRMKPACEQWRQACWIACCNASSRRRGGRRCACSR